MALNIVFIAFFVVAFIVALCRLIFAGDVEVFPNIINSTFDSSKTAVEISLGLIGIMALWLGIMKVGERGGVVQILAKAVSPFFNKLFPGIPKNHPVYGSIIMNYSANMLGLDNAATPLGLKAMKELQEINPSEDTASNAQIMFIVLNASSLTLIPVSIMAYRSNLGAANPSDVFLPILLATFFSTLTALIVVALYQKINLLNKTLLLVIGSLALGIGGLLYYFSTLSQSEINSISSVVGNGIIFSVIVVFFIMAWKKKVNVYEAFIDGAKEGFNVAIMIIPYLVAILVAVGVFRASGSMEFIIDGIGAGVHALGLNADFVPSLPVALMKPLSGSGARGLMIEVMQNFGADSFPGRVASVMQGSTETTFYVLAVYFGAVNIKKTRHALPAALISELAGVVAAIFISYLFFY